MGAVVLQHFSHEHPLVLFNHELPKDAKYVCYGCQQPIIANTGSPALFYYCKSYGCNYLLHKKCGELPLAVKHPDHPQHHLTLVSGLPPGYTECGCDVCGVVNNLKSFTYHCSECQFDAHVSCTPLEERPKEHKFHDHPLTFTQRPSSFFCDACGTEGEDLSYRCSNTSCQFLIHDKCASSQNTIKRNDHSHPLQLSYSIPYSKRKFDYNCYICDKVVLPNYWVYYCASCTYFAHLKCGTSKEDEPSLFSGATSTEDLGQDLVCLPERGLMDMMSQFSIDARIIYDENVQSGCPNCQFEPLIDDDVDRNKEMKKKEILCDVCVRPIIFPSPYSNCVKCSFVAHTRCTLFKLEILHPSHPQHPLTLSYTFRSSVTYTICDICGGGTNGYVFRCITCGDFKIDVSCATTCLPKRIKHDAHKYHPLTLQNVVDSNTGLRRSCKACGGPINHNYGMEYVCDSSINCDYHLHTYCAMLPGTLGHDWDKHPMSLTYPPFSHPEDYFCETCEEDIHPTHWLYHCSKCDHSFHTNCALPHDHWSKFKVGITYKLEVHEHNLITVRKPKKSRTCYNCKEWYPNFPSLDCASCDYQICVDCGRRADSKIIE